jgi:hypothetical protein
MPADAILQSARALDLSPRIAHTETVVGSPATNAETTIASLAIPSNLAIQTGVLLVGWCAFTVGTSGDGVNLKIHQTNSSGTTIAASGLITSTAANLDARSIVGFDTAPPAGGVYILTMTVHGGAAVSTVSAVEFFALVV